MAAKGPRPQLWGLRLWSSLGQKRPLRSWLYRWPLFDTFHTPSLFPRSGTLRALPPDLGYRWCGARAMSSSGSDDYPSKVSFPAGVDAIHWLVPRSRCRDMELLACCYRQGQGGLRFLGGFFIRLEFLPRGVCPGALRRLRHFGLPRGIVAS